MNRRASGPARAATGSGAALGARDQERDAVSAMP